MVKTSTLQLAFLLGGISLLLAVSSCAPAEQVQGPWEGETVVIFPENYSAQFKIMHAGLDADQVPPHAFGTDLFAARGPILIPQGAVVALRFVTEAEDSIDLSPLEEIPNERLYALVFAIANIPASELEGLDRHQRLQQVLFGPFTRIDGNFLAPLSQVESLRVLEVSGGHESEIDTVTDEEFANLGKLANLERLVLDADKDQWQMTDAGLQHLSGLTKLQQLNLGGPKITDNGLQFLQELTRLENLTIRGENITGQGLRHISDLEALRDLSLSHTSLTDEGLRHLASLSSLQILQLEDTAVTDEGLRHLAGVTGLEQLNLSSAPITGEGLGYLTGLYELRELDLSRTRLTDSALRHLSELPRLRVLRISSTNLTDAGLEQLMALKQLDYLSAIETSMTQEGIGEFKRAVPGCVVHFSRRDEPGSNHQIGPDPVAGTR